MTNEPSITPEEGLELEQLKLLYLDATRRAADAIKAHGMDIDEFLGAEAEAVSISRKIKEIVS